MNLKDIKNWETNYNNIVNAFYIRPRVNIKLSYQEKEEIITAIVSVTVLNNSYREINNLVTVTFNQNGELINFECLECEHECTHITIACYILAKNYDNIIKNLKIKLDYKMSDILMNLKKRSITKELCNLKIQLEYQDYNEIWILNLKIGTNKSYILRKNINEFLESYYSKEGTVYFGKEFIYNPNLYFFNDSDKNLLSILPNILESNENNYSQNRFNIITSGLVIKKNMLKSMLDIFYDNNITFAVLINDTLHNDIKISSDYYPSVKLSKKDSGLLLTFDSNSYLPLIEDNSYIYFNENFYYLDEEKRSLLKEFELCKTIIIEEKEIPDFTKYLLPNIRKLTDNLSMSDELKEEYTLVKPLIKLYFDVDDNDNIICYAKATYKTNELNILDENMYLKYNILRDEITEKECINYLNNMGFTENKAGQCFVLIEEDKNIEFIKEHLNKLNIYESYISNKLKSIKYIKNPSISSSVKLDQGELLSCNFKISGIDDNEISSILEAIRYKRKYYKMKNGSYLSIENDSDLEDLNNFVTNLDINLKDMAQKEITIPKFKALYIASQKDNYNFINTNQELEDFINNFKKSKDKKIDIPNPNNIELRDYQRQGVKWLANIANYGFGSILADEMGLGKTLQAIMYVKMRLEENNKREILIVCPTSLIYNWEAEFNRFAPNIKVKVIAEIRKKREKIFDELNDYEVFITSYGLLREDIDKYKLINYDTIIIDEAQAIKNPHSLISKALKELNASTKFALTGTPIENSITELYSIFDFIMPGFLGSQTSFSKKYEKIMNSDKKFQDDFNKLIAPFILRRNKKDVIKELPDKMEKNIIVELEEEQKKYYLAELKKINKEVGTSISSGTFKKNKLLILQSLTRLRQICITPSLYVDNYKGGSAKLDLLVDILTEITPNHKVLLFSQFTSALSLVAKRLNKAKISYYYLDGSTKAKDRINSVNDFNNDDTKVFLISLKAGGNGLNLTGADTVIHLDLWWNPAVEDQATDRAHRIGQKKVVEVIKIICKGTIEEKIIKLQEKKKSLSKLVIEGKMESDKVVDKLTEQDILYLLGTE